MAVHDLVVRGGVVVDGSGTPGQVGDVAVDGGVITEVGTDVGRGRRELDAEGRVVTPGWVDIHTHYDGQVTWDPEVSPSGWHGVTTVVMGNCGVGFAPARPGDRDWLIQLMEGVEDIPGTALAEGMPWTWESFPDYLDEVERMGRVLDVAGLLPHGALRAYVLGEGRANDEAKPDELSEMARLVRQAVEAGAIGISSTRTLLHRAKDGELAAGTTAATKELVALGSQLAGAGRRVFSVASDLLDLDREFGWMAEVSTRARVPVTYQVLQVEFAPDLWRTWMDRALDANRRGAWLVPQVAGKPTSVLVGFESAHHLFSSHQAYQPLADLPFEERIARLRDPEVRRTMVTKRVSTYGLQALLLGSLGRLFPLGDPPQYEPSPDDSVAAIAERQGRPAIEVAYDLMLEREGRELLYLPIFGYANGGLDATREMLAHPSAVLGLGDGGAHCGVLCDGSLPTFMLTHWVRDRDRGPRLPLEHVVHLLSRRGAELYGFDDRGLVAPGYLADLNVVDLDGLRLHRPEMAHDLPAGGRRLIQRASGYTATVKSGVVVREDDELTGERPGGLLRGPRPEPPNPGLAEMAARSRPAAASAGGLAGVLG